MAAAETAQYYERALLKLGAVEQTCLQTARISSQNSFNVNPFNSQPTAYRVPARTPATTGLSSTPSPQPAVATATAHRFTAHTGTESRHTAGYSSAYVVPSKLSFKPAAATATPGSRL